jgi:signal transduction histidine kinase
VKKTDLEKICQEVLLEVSFPEDIDVKCVVDDEAKEVIADPTFLKRVFINLISNAIQAMPKGGNLEIQARREIDEVVITVQDSGVGVPEDIKNKLFTPLFTTKAKGQGFGLPVVKRMTEALDGNVTFESKEGKGTKFIIRLPATQK